MNDLISFLYFRIEFIFLAAFIAKLNLFVLVVSNVNLGKNFI